MEIKHIRKSVTFEVEGDLEPLKMLYRDLVSSGKSIELGIEEITEPVKFNILSGAKPQYEAWLSITVSEESFSDLRQWISQEIFILI